MLLHNGPKEPNTYTYYHAGPLFTVAELHTNILLARTISSQSNGKFIPILPQELEQRDLSPHSIRDEDLRALLSCDMALFTYDGAELDPGTVVEYMVAKMADIPAVILRTDFRGGGDQNGDGDAWNLMTSNWPRSVGVQINAMSLYKSSMANAIEAKGNQDVSLFDSLVDKHLIGEVSRQVIEGFETLLKEKPRLPEELRASVYQWLALMPGFKSGPGGVGGDQENIEALRQLSESKAKEGLL